MPTGQASLMPAIRRVVLAKASADRSDGQLLGAFITDRDADAFGLLVRRHGPMVLGVCRRVIGDHTHAEDAFQAVFIVLARRASSVKPREQVGNWLYGVAYRTALKARAVLARRRSREKQVDVMPDPVVHNCGGLTGTSLPDWSDLQPVIDEELARLPEKLRSPVVLCDIEGRSQREVAKHLGVPPATLATRLATARRTLAQRLTKRGVTLSAGAIAGLLTMHGTVTAVPHALTQSLTRAAEAVATGNAVSSLVSASAVQLSEGVMRMMLLNKLKAVAIFAMTAVALTTGLGLGLVPAYAEGTGDPAPVQHEKAAVAPPAAPASQATNPPARQRTTAAIDKLIEAKWTADADVDDATFLRRLVLDVRGTTPTDIEMLFFVNDPDEKKRRKVVEWLVTDGDVRSYAARLLNVKDEQIQLVQVADTENGKVRGLVIVLDATAIPATNLAFSPDGRRLAIELRQRKPAGDRLIVNEKYVELNTVDDKTIQSGTKAMGELVQVAPNNSEWIAPPNGLWVTPNQQGESFFRLQRRVASADAKGDTVYLFETASDAIKPQAYTLMYDGSIRSWDKIGGKTFAVFDESNNLEVWNTQLDLNVIESDIDFLKRVTQAARGGAPTALEEKYFTEDKDPKKREKLIDTLLRDPAVAKKLGEDFKKKMLAGPNPKATTSTTEGNFKYYILPDTKNVWEYNLTPNFVNPAKPIVPGTWTWDLSVLPVTPTQPQPPATPKPPQPPAPPKTPQPPAAPQVDKMEKLVGELLAAKKTDSEMLEAVTLATASRLPTDTEKKLTLGLVAKAADRKAAWVEVAKILSATDDGKKLIELHFRNVPPAK
jgi:RNA polymerase sigma factor (sigma-70 family)